MPLQLSVAGSTLLSQFHSPTAACRSGYGQELPNRVSNILLCYHIPCLPSIDCALELRRHPWSHEPCMGMAQRHVIMDCSVGTAAAQRSLARAGATRKICMSLRLRYSSSFPCEKIYRRGLVVWIKTLGCGGELAFI